jgi:hypothetical protein
MGLNYPLVSLRSYFLLVGALSLAKSHSFLNPFNLHIFNLLHLCYHVCIAASCATVKKDCNLQTALEVGLT